MKEYLMHPEKSLVVTARRVRANSDHAEDVMACSSGVRSVRSNQWGVQVCRGS